MRLALTHMVDGGKLRPRGVICCRTPAEGGPRRISQDGTLPIAIQIAGGFVQERDSARMKGFSSGGGWKKTPATACFLLEHLPRRNTGHGG